MEKIDFKKLNELYHETARHLELLNLKESVQNSPNTTNLLNVALEDVLFMFRKVSEDELIISDRLRDMLRKTREALGSNFDQQDPEFTTLYDELKRLFNKKNLDEISQEEMKQNIIALQQIYGKITELNRRNNLLKAKYQNDVKYARIHKRIVEKRTIFKREADICETLHDIKKRADERVLINTKLLNNENYFKQMMTPMVINSFEKHKIKLDPESAKYINNCVVKEYISEFQGVQTW